MTSHEAAYLAGVVDGEGHLGIQRIPPKHGGSTPKFYFRAKITNTNLAWLEGIQVWIGGRIGRMDSLKRKNRRPCYDLALNGVEAQTMLSRVLPYLRLKQEHAQIVMRFLDAAQRRRDTNQPSRPSDPAVVAELQALYEELKSKNLRGLVQDWPKTPQQGRTCQIDGCHRPHQAQGYCPWHYRKYVTRGGPAWHESACKLCGKPFGSKRSDAVFCSHTCANTDYKRRTRHPELIPS